MKNTKKPTTSKAKQPISYIQNTDTEKVVWVYDKIDKNCPFPFDIQSERFQHQEFLEKMISYSNMTWSEVKRQTHDDGRSKNHLLNADGMVKEAQERIKKLRLEEYSDNIFSFSFGSKLRIIGIRDHEKFHVLWYDPKHEVYPSKKTHT